MALLRGGPARCGPLARPPPAQRAIIGGAGPRGPTDRLSGYGLCPCFRAARLELASEHAAGHRDVAQLLRLSRVVGDERLQRRVAIELKAAVDKVRAPGAARR